MILADIRSYLERRGQASLADLALHFDSDPDALRGMLQVWIRKGRVSKGTATAACGSSCCRCDPAATELYTWLGTHPGPRVFPLQDCSDATG